jgi:hypothetical protein
MSEMPVLKSAEPFMMFDLPEIPIELFFLIFKAEKTVFQRHFYGILIQII